MQNINFSKINVNFHVFEIIKSAFCKDSQDTHKLIMIFRSIIIIIFTELSKYLK